MVNWRLFSDDSDLTGSDVVLKIVTPKGRVTYRTGRIHRYKDKWVLKSDINGFYYFQPNLNLYYINLNEIL